LHARRRRFAVTQLAQDLQKGGSYVEEAVRLGVTDVLTRLMKACGGGRRFEASIR